MISHHTYPSLFFYTTLGCDPAPFIPALFSPGQQSACLGLVQFMVQEVGVVCGNYHTMVGN